MFVSTLDDLRKERRRGEIMKAMRCNYRGELEWELLASETESRDVFH